MSEFLDRMLAFEKKQQQPDARLNDEATRYDAMIARHENRISLALAKTRAVYRRVRGRLVKV